MKLIRKTSNKKPKTKNSQKRLQIDRSSACKTATEIYANERTKSDGK